MEQLAAEHELVAVPSVTRTRCDVLVAADTASRSGKARKALDLGKPVISAAGIPRMGEPRRPGPIAPQRPLGWECRPEESLSESTRAGRSDETRGN